MKKIFVISILMLTLLLTGCGNKKVYNTKSFSKEIKKQEYTINNSKEQYSEYKYIKDCIIATSPKKTYQIEFYELINEKNAKEMYETNKKEFNNSISGIYSKYEEKFGNYSKYFITTDKEYRLVYRIKNTIIYTETEKNNQKNIEQTLKLLKIDR